MAEPIARIIVVDDEVAQMEALRDTLSDSGFAVSGFSDSRAALSTLREKRFDLMLSDLMMPELDGITLLREAKETDPDLMVIIMTGQGTIATAVEAMKSGAFDYITKPFKLSVVLPVLSRALAVRELRMENAALHDSLRLRTIELERVNRELDDFASSIAHDLGAPVRHIEAYARDLREEIEGTASDSARANLVTIISSAQRLGRLIRDVLQFSRVSRTGVRHGPVDLNQTLKEALQRLEPEQRGRQILWKTGDLPHVDGDESLLQQVLWNLLSNAIKFTKLRTVAEIEVGTLASEGEDEIFVRDNGAGFDMKTATGLFGVFRRLHNKEEFEGSGVGLANVRRIVERHGGRVWFEAEAGKGATFHFTIPHRSGQPAS